MYRVKSHKECKMPKDSTPLSCVVLNGSLKHGKDLSNTEELAQLVLDAMLPYKVESKIIRLADKKIPVGLGFKESSDDEWPGIVEAIRKADIVIFATPVWWGNRSSLMQRVIERLDALDEEYLASGRSVLLNKVAGIVITGSEDGAQATLGGLMEVLTFMNFTLPPECCAYWVGEVGQDPKQDREKRLKSEAARNMSKNLARNLVFYAQLLKLHPMQIKE